MDFIAHDRAGCVERHEQLFAHDEIGSNVDTSDGCGAVLDAPQYGPTVDLGRPTLLPECHAERIDHLQGIGPDLQSVLRVSEHR
jgi:hypothetical protein